MCQICIQQIPHFLYFLVCIKHVQLDFCFVCKYFFTDFTIFSVKNFLQTILTFVHYVVESQNKNKTRQKFKTIWALNTALQGRILFRVTISGGLPNYLNTLPVKKKLVKLGLFTI